MTRSMPATMSASGISSGAKQKLFAAFASHPPLEQRIATLQQLSV